MNLAAFERLIPGLIRHRTWGFQYLETKKYTKGVMACYRGDNKLASFGTYGKDWQEVFDQLHNALKESSLV